MHDCIIAGDSIAVGTHTFKQECVSYARGGINSGQFNRMYPVVLNASTVIISLGSNDHIEVKTKHELETMRARVYGKRVFWILPAGNHPQSGVSITTIQSIVREIAVSNGDIIIEISELQSDRIHPSWSGYRSIVKRIKEAGG